MAATAPNTNESKTFQLRVTGMDCASCAKTIEKGIIELDGVDEARVNFTAETLEARGDVSEAALRERIEMLGYGVAGEAGGDLAPAAGVRAGVSGFLSYVWQHRDTRAALFGGLAVLAAMPASVLSDSGGVAIFVSTLQWVVIAIVGYPIAVKGVRSLIYARQITIDLLMTTATIGAVAIGASGEAVTVVLLFTLGEALEGYSSARSRDSLHALLGLRPDEATVIVDDETEEDSAETSGTHRHYVTRAVAELSPGDRILVRPGERIAADGFIVDGESSVDEAAITGESLPVHRAIGAEVSAGTINGEGTLEIEVSRAAEDFTITQIANLVARAQAERSPAERFVDRFAQSYTPAVVGLAVLVATLPPLAFGQSWLSAADGSTGWLYRGLALLIIACPCALIISIPVTVVSALTRLAGLGILVKGGAQLSELAAAKVFAFDKTGTLTHGRPRVAGLRSRECAHEESSLEVCEPCDELVAVAAAVERGSGHPLAHAVLHAASERDILHRYGRATAITTHAGRGVSGTVNGQRVTVGHQELFPADEKLRSLLATQSPNASSIMLVGEGDDVLGYIEVADALRPETATALAALRDIDKDYRFVMLTGDREDVAESVGKEIGDIDEIRAGLLPDHKLDAVRELEHAYGTVAMIGDGINDTPALAGARLGVAMGGAGSHQAMEVADIVLMKDDLGQLSRAVAVSRKTGRVIRENIALSLGLKLVFLALAVPGLATLWMAVLADVGTTLLVTLNGMRMLRAR